jgi:hypothetical protein
MMMVVGFKQDAPDLAGATHHRSACPPRASFEQLRGEAGRLFQSSISTTIFWGRTRFSGFYFFISLGFGHRTG